MVTTATPAIPQQLSLEEKIDMAVVKSSQIVNMFSPMIGQAIDAGAEVEPIISGLVQMFIGIFSHHMKKQTPAQQ